MKFYKLFKSKNPLARRIQLILPVAPPEKIPLKIFRSIHPIDRKIRFVLPVVDQSGLSE